MSSHRLPTPAPDDHEDVVLALHTAAALWGRGDTHEAVHWVRRAATSAEENGADMRAVALARAAADLTTDLAVPPSVRASAAPLAAATPAAVNAGIGGFAPAAPLRPSDPASGLLDADDTDKTVVDQSPAARAAAGPAVPAMPRAYRVVVGQAPEPGSLIVRVLAENEAAPEGTKEAVLLALDWELDLSEPGT